MLDRIVSWHELAYWMSAGVCLTTAAFCFSSAVMNAHFAVGVENPEPYTNAARYWMYGCGGFLLLAFGAGVKATLVRRRNRISLRRAG